MVTGGEVPKYYRQWGSDGGGGGSDWGVGYDFGADAMSLFDGGDSSGGWADWGGNAGDMWDSSGVSYDSLPCVDCGGSSGITEWGSYYYNPNGPTSAQLAQMSQMAAKQGEISSVFTSPYDPTVFSLSMLWGDTGTKWMSAESVTWDPAAQQYVQNVPTGGNTAKVAQPTATASSKTQPVQLSTLGKTAATQLGKTGLPVVNTSGAAGKALGQTGQMYDSNGKFIGLATPEKIASVLVDGKVVTGTVLDSKGNPIGQPIQEDVNTRVSDLSNFGKANQFGSISRSANTNVLGGKSQDISNLINNGLQAGGQVQVAVVDKDNQVVGSQLHTVTAAEIASHTINNATVIVGAPSQLAKDYGTSKTVPTDLSGVSSRPVEVVANTAGQFEFTGVTLTVNGTSVPVDRSTVSGNLVNGNTKAELTGAELSAAQSGVQQRADSCTLASTAAGTTYLPQSGMASGNTYVNTQTGERISYDTLSASPNANNGNYGLQTTQVTINNEVYSVPGNSSIDPGMAVVTDQSTGSVVPVNDNTSGSNGSSCLTGPWNRGGRMDGRRSEQS